jgi:glycosyltransferase involved in cell wall biosynthesis
MAAEITIFICGLLLLLFAIVQTGMVFAFCRWLARSEQSPATNALPHAAVVLSVRGESKSLVDCLCALQNIEYPSYEIHIIVDSQNDVSLKMINDWQDKCVECSIQIHILSDISKFASLKTSAVRQCVQTLGNHVNSIAILDADTVVHKEWLRELITPLLDSKVGISTGNRWYDPTEMKLGNQIRFLYNAWAVPGMHFMNTVWGGSLGISHEVFTHPDFFDTFANTPTEESGVQDICKKLGLKLAQQGNLMMAQRGDITVSSALGFIIRQLVWTRLHYREWIGVFVGPLLIYSVTVCLAACASISIYNGNRRAFVMAATLFLVYWVFNWLLIAYLNRSVVAKMSLRDKWIFPKTKWSSHLAIFLMIPVGFVAFVFALFKAQFAKSISWSGIDYRIRPPHRIELIEYRPSKP